MWIAANAVVTRGVKINSGAVIAASAVVTHDVPPYEIWAGVPARKIGQRFCDKIIEELLTLKWWEAEDVKIRENIELFQGKLTMDKVLRLKECLQAV